MEKHTEDQSILCKACNKFYGSRQTNFLCSGCFKANQKTVQPPPVEDQKTNQDKSRCFQCKRKVGLLGYQCRCKHSFCKLHRLSEDHGCQFDFAALDKQKLAKMNPTVRSQKLQKI